MIGPEPNRNYQGAPPGYQMPNGQQMPPNGYQMPNGAPIGYPPNLQGYNPMGFGYTMIHQSLGQTAAPLTHCAYCGKPTETRVELMRGSFWWGMCVLLFLFTGPFAFLIDVCPSVKDHENRCALCGENKWVIDGTC